VKALLDIVKQLEEREDRSSKILNTFMTLVDITEADEISFVKFREDGEIEEALFKKKGQNEYMEKMELSPRLIDKYRRSESSISFVDWEEIVSYDETTNIPNWKSYIILSFDEPKAKGLLAISVNIKDKEFDFGNLNFVESLKPVLRHILF
jgi:hypothetical protein